MTPCKFPATSEHQFSICWRKNTRLEIHHISEYPLGYPYRCLDIHSDFCQMLRHFRHCEHVFWHFADIQTIGQIIERYPNTYPDMCGHSEDIWTVGRHMCRHLVDILSHVQIAENTIFSNKSELSVHVWTLIQMSEHQSRQCIHLDTCLSEYLADIQMAMGTLCRCLDTSVHPDWKRWGFKALPELHSFHIVCFRFFMRNILFNNLYTCLSTW